MLGENAEVDKNNWGRALYSILGGLNFVLWEKAGHWNTLKSKQTVKFFLLWELLWLSYKGQRMSDSYVWK